MLRGHEKMRLPDENKVNDLLLEVNWEPKNPQSNECKLIRLHYPNGDMAVVRRDHINALLFAMGTPEQQRNLIPQTLRSSRHYETVVSVKAKKNISKGEDITFPLKLTLPGLEEEIISDIRSDLLDKRTTL